MYVLLIGFWIYCVVSYCVYAELVVGEYVEVTLCVSLFEGHGDGCQFCSVDHVSFSL